MWLSELLEIEPSIGRYLHRFGPLPESQIRFADYCLMKGLDPVLMTGVWKLLVGDEEGAYEAFRRVDPSTMSDYLLASHHWYKNSLFPRLVQLAGQRLDQLGCELPHCSEVLNAFLESRINALRAHFQYEEQHVFPFVKWMNSVTGLPFNAAIEDGLRALDQLEAEHCDLRHEFAEIRQWLKKAAKSADGHGLEPVWVLFEQLENELFVHDQLEDLVLFPRLRDQLMNAKAGLN